MNLASKTGTQHPTFAAKKQEIGRSSRVGNERTRNARRARRSPKISRRQMSREVSPSRLSAELKETTWRNSSQDAETPPVMAHCDGRCSDGAIVDAARAYRGSHLTLGRKRSARFHGVFADDEASESARGSKRAPTGICPLVDQVLDHSAEQPAVMSQSHFGAGILGKRLVLRPLRQLWHPG